MKAYYLVQFGESSKAFEERDLVLDPVGDAEVRIETEGFGLNYADIMARKGMYKDCPPLPAVIGYDAVGRVVEIGKDVTRCQLGDRVLVFTRFGGYASHIQVGENSCAKIPEDLGLGPATALATQYCTAWYASNIATTIVKGDAVLIQAAAGGVGTALVQIAKRRGAYIYGTAGSQEKLEYLKEMGVDYPINYRQDDFYEIIKKHRGSRGIDVVFDSIGGTTFAQGRKLLSKGGRIMFFGVASRSQGKGIFADLKLLWNSGFLSPLNLILSSTGINGINMLHIADHNPRYLEKCLSEVVDNFNSGYLAPPEGREFGISELAKAHDYLENRKSIGKVCVRWK